MSNKYVFCDILEGVAGPLLGLEKMDMECSFFLGTQKRTVKFGEQRTERGISLQTGLQISGNQSIGICACGF